MIYVSKKKRILAFFMMIVLLVSCLFINYNGVQAYSVSTKKTGINNFPSSYQSYLNKLKSKHPNWNFVAVYTHLDWNYVIDNEMVTNRSLVPITSPNSWKLNEKQVESGWVNASRKAVTFFLDPRNFLTEEKIFQFEVNTYNSSEHTLEAVTNILKGTPMGEVVDGVDYTKKYKKSGKWVDMKKSYAQIILEAGKKYNVSPVHLASRIIQENGGNILNNKCIYGSYSGYEGYYNFMNVGATPDGEGAVVNALKYAKNNGWTDPEKAIYGAAKKIYDQYIYYGQNTIYFEKFDVNFIETSKYLFGSQYMTNIIAPSSESNIMYKAYNASNKINSNFTFNIPVYDNMPSSTTDIVDGEYTADNTLVYLDDTSDKGVTDTFNIRDIPDGSIIEVIKETKEGQDNRTILTRILKGKNTGWDKVRLPDGREGYVSSKYVKEYSYVKVQSVSLNEINKSLKIGEEFKLTATVSPNNAKIKDITWSTSDASVATVDDTGKVVAKGAGEAKIKVTTKDQSKTAECSVQVISKVDLQTDEEITFDKSLNVSEDNYISNVEIDTTVQDLKKKINVKGLEFKVLDKDSKELKDTDLIATGTKVQILRKDTIAGEYIVIVYGDVNLDAKITASDYVLIKNHIMGTGKLSVTAYKAADMNKNSKVAASDYVLIKNYIMKK